jgi:hypothetical protein
MKEFFFLLGIFSLGLFFLTSVHAEGCYPLYSCNDWGNCINGFSNRTCVDTTCGFADIIERKICENANCVTNIKCEEWSSCLFNDKLDDIIQGKVRFLGYQQRECIDSNKCLSSYTEQKTCEENFAVNYTLKEECGQKYLVMVDSAGHESTKINIDSWRNNSLKIQFVVGGGSYCPSCYNNKQDFEETGIDCGGNCKACTVEKDNFWYLVASSWILTIFLFILVWKLSLRKGARFKF